MHIITLQLFLILALVTGLQFDFFQLLTSLPFSNKLRVRLGVHEMSEKHDSKVYAIDWNMILQ